MMSNWFRSLLFVTLCGVETGQSYAKLSLTMTVYPGFGEGRVKMTCSRTHSVMNDTTRLGMKWMACFVAGSWVSIAVQACSRTMTRASYSFLSNLRSLNIWSFIRNLFSVYLLLIALGCEPHMLIYHLINYSI